MAITDFFTGTTNGTRPEPTTVNSTRSIGVTTLSCDALTGWEQSTAVHFVTYKTDADGNKKPGSQCDWKGIVSGTTITNLTLKAGTDVGNAIGDVVVCMPTAAWAEDMVAGILTHANQDGTLKTGAVDNTAVIGSDVVEQTNLHEKLTDYSFDFIASGCVWSGDSYGSTRNASCTSGVVYLSGKRLTVAAVSARTFTASKDVYCDLHDNGDGTAVWVYTDNTTNAASPALTAGNLRGAIIVVGASNIANAAAVNQGQEDRLLPIASSVPYAVTDSLGNLICPRDPSRQVLGIKRLLSEYTADTANAWQAVTGLSAPVIVPLGRKIKCTLQCPNVKSNNTAGSTTLGIAEGAVGAGAIKAYSSQEYPATTKGSPIVVSTVYTPTTSSITLNVGLKSVWSTTMWAESIAPIQLLVELV